MQPQHTTSQRQHRRRSVSQSSGTGNLALTALSIGAVLVLLGATFLADLLRTPGLSLTSNSTLISPNGDQDLDFATLVYELDEAASLSVEVLTENGQVVRTLLAAATQPAGQAFVTWDGSGDFATRLADGVYRLQATARGTLRSVTRSVLVEIDTQAPSLQLVNLPDGARLRDAVLNIQGLTDPGASVWLSSDPAPLFVDAQGRFTLQARLIEGVNLLDVRAVDTAGNTARLQRQVELVTAPPDLVLESPVENAWLNQPLVTLRGSLPALASLTVNNQNVPVNAGGSFEYQLLLDEGQNTLRLVAVDDVGNVTNLDRVVYIKTQPPALSLNISEGQTLTSATLQLTGSTEPGAAVSVNARPVPVGPSGNFQTAVSLVEGNNQIEVNVRDQAGNLTNVSRRVVYNLPAPTEGIFQLFGNLSELPAGVWLAGLGVPLLLFLILLVRQRPITLDLAVDQPTFLPGVPGESEVLTIFMGLDRPATVTLEILDQHEQVLATLLQNRRRGARRYRLTWDGLDDFGQLAPPGVYLIQAEAQAFPSNVTSSLRILVADRKTTTLAPARSTRRSHTAAQPAAPTTETYLPVEPVEDLSPPVEQPLRYTRRAPRRTVQRRNPDQG